MTRGSHAHAYTKFITYAMYAIDTYPSIERVHSVGNTVYARACEPVFFSTSLPDRRARR
jgi:hypothetical protein